MKCYCTFLLASLALQPLAAQGPLDYTREKPEAEGLGVFDMSPAELLNLPTYLTTGESRGWLDTPAAAYMVTQSEMHQAGHRHLAEQLRMVPGVMVSRSAVNSWSISTRSFQNQFAGTQLVLQDGRETYTPTFGGVFWDTADLPVEILGSIEVIRGPGATLWGSNAVNGIIDIRTLHARNAQENVVTLGGGDGREGQFSFRQGGKLPGGHYYTWGKWTRQEQGLPDPADGSSQYTNLYKTGFRADLQPNGIHNFTLHAEYYDLDAAHRISGPAIIVNPFSPNSFPPNYFLGDFSKDYQAQGGSLHGTWEANLDSGLDLKASSYFARDDRLMGAISLDFVVDTYEADFQVKKKFGGHLLQAGIRHRRHEYDFETTGLPASLTSTVGAGTAAPLLGFPSTTYAEEIHSGFLQDTFTLRDGLHLLAGTKYEENATGDYWHPSARIWWQPKEDTTLWGSYSVAHQMPGHAARHSIITYGYAAAGPTFFPLTITADPSLRSGKLRQGELGVRKILHEGLTLDLAAYLGDFAHFYLGETGGDTNTADTYGGEISLGWKPTPELWIRSSASYSDTDVQGPGATLNLFSQAKWRGNLRADITPPGPISYFLAFYASERAFPQIPGYVRTDVGATWMPNQTWDASLHIQNLFDPSHPEDLGGFNDDPGYEVPRSVYLRFRRWF